MSVSALKRGYNCFLNFAWARLPSAKTEDRNVCSSVKFHTWYFIPKIGYSFERTRGSFRRPQGSFEQSQMTIHLGQFNHCILRQRLQSCPHVLLDTRWSHTFRDHYRSTLHSPSDENLRRRASHSLGNRLESGIFKKNRIRHIEHSCRSIRRAKWRISRYDNAVCVAEIFQLWLRKIWVPFNLIDRRLYFCKRQNLFHLLDAKVGNADCSHQTLFYQGLHCCPSLLDRHVGKIVRAWRQLNTFLQTYWPMD